MPFPAVSSTQSSEHRLCASLKEESNESPSEEEDEQSTLYGSPLCEAEGESESTLLSDSCSTASSTAPTSVLASPRGQSKELAKGSSLTEPLLAKDDLEAGCAGEVAMQLPVFRSSIFVVLPCFAAYACLFSLQHDVKVVYGVADDNSSSSHNFSHATSSLFVFKLIFRFLHNIMLRRLCPRQRLYVGMGALVVALIILSLVTSRIASPWPGYVLIAYSLGGAGVGSFEANVLASFLYLGAETKKFAVLGMPLGASSIMIGGFIVRYLGAPVHCIYMAVIAALVGGACVLRFRIPAPQDLELQADRAPIKRKCTLMLGLRSFDTWLPAMWSRALTSALDTATVEVFAPALLLFIYNSPGLVLLSPPAWSHPVVVPKDLFFVVYNMCTAIGSLVGRYTAYRVERTIHPAWCLTLLVSGATLIVSSLPGHSLAPLALVLAPLGAFTLLVADGFIYVMNARFIDEQLKVDHHTAVVSCWLFTADAGSTAGANFVPYIRDWVSL